MTDRLFHIVERGAWQRAGAHYRPDTFAADGFVHFSFAHQVSRVANARYRDCTDLVVVEVDPDALGEPVVVEDSYGGGEAFPHVYAPIRTAAAVAQYELTRDAHGDWQFTPGAATGGASPGR